MNNDDKEKANEVELAVLEERIRLNEKLFDQRLDSLKNYVDSFKNYGLIILTVISIISYGGIKYIIKTIVTEKTEATLNETLKPKYIEEKIREKSTHAINNLIKETETRARRIMEEHSTFFDWEMRANEAMENKDYEKAVEYFNSTIKKIGYIDDESYRNKKYYPTYFRLARAQFLSRNYKGALENLNNAKIKLGKYDPPIYPSKNPEVERYFMMNIIQGGIGKDTSKTEQKLEEFKKQDILPSGWLFAEMWSLSKDADVDEKVKSYINDFVPKYIGKDKLVEILKKQGKLP